MTELQEQEFRNRILQLISEWNSVAVKEEQNARNSDMIDISEWHKGRSVAYQNCADNLKKILE